MTALNKQALREQIESAADAYWQFDNGWISDMKCGDLSHEYSLFVKEPKNVLALLDELETKEEQRANWFQMAQKLGEDLDAAEKRIAKHRKVLNSLAAVARRYLPDYDEHPEIQAADELLESAAGIGVKGE